MKDEDVIDALLENGIPEFLTIMGRTYKIPIADIEVIPSRLRIGISAGTQEKELFLKVTDAANKLSLGLDGTQIFLRGIGLAGQITSGRCLIRVEEPVEIALKDPSGNFLSFEKVDGRPAQNAGT